MKTTDTMNWDITLIVDMLEEVGRIPSMPCSSKGRAQKEEESWVERGSGSGRGQDSSEEKQRDNQREIGERVLANLEEKKAQGERAAQDKKGEEVELVGQEQEQVVLYNISQATATGVAR